MKFSQSTMYEYCLKTKVVSTKIDPAWWVFTPLCNKNAACKFMA